jgi:hypothetical protein
VHDTIDNPAESAVFWSEKFNISSFRLDREGPVPLTSIHLLAVDLRISLKKAAIERFAVNIYVPSLMQSIYDLHRCTIWGWFIERSSCERNISSSLYYSKNPDPAETKLQHVDALISLFLFLQVPT